MSLQECLETSVCPAFSPFLWGFILLLPFLPRSSPFGAMIAVRVALTPPPSHGVRAPPSSVPLRAVTLGAATGKGMEVVLGHPSPYAPGNISVGEAVSMAHQALSQA
jgi:hypothetical protein